MLTFAEVIITEEYYRGGTIALLLQDLVQFFWTIRYMWVIHIASATASEYVVFGRMICYDVTITAVCKNSCIYHYESFTIDRQRYWDHAVEFVLWQHPAMGRRATFTCLTYRHIV